MAEKKKKTIEIPIPLFGALSNVGSKLGVSTTAVAVMAMQQWLDEIAEYPYLVKTIKDRINEKED